MINCMPTHRTHIYSIHCNSVLLTNNTYTEILFAETAKSLNSVPWLLKILIHCKPVFQEIKSVSTSATTGDNPHTVIIKCNYIRHNAHCHHLSVTTSATTHTVIIKCNYTSATTNTVIIKWNLIRYNPHAHYV